MKNELGKLPESLQEIVRYFSDLENTHKWAVALRWPNGIECPRCNSKEHSYVSTRHLWFCKGCKKQFTVKVGSIFEDSPLGMDKWMMAVWLIVTCKNGISSYEIASHLGISQKSAWHMMHRIRKALQDQLTGGMLGGEIEVDETFIGGKVRNMHKARKAKVQTQGRNLGNKTIVAGVLQRGGKVHAGVVPDRSKASIQDIVKGAVEPGSQLYCDEHGKVWQMDEYEHQMVNHLEQYANGNVHTNGMENFWSLLKRGLQGTYISVEPFHLFRYIDEQAFRFNNRKLSATERFVEAMKSVSGKRLTWDNLTGKELETQTQVN